MTQEFRLAQGGRIDRGRTLSFHFDGRRYEGHPGDTLASALLANGVRLVGRSFKFHRPRGIFSAGVRRAVGAGPGRGRAEPPRHRDRSLRRPGRDRPACLAHAALRRGGGRGVDRTAAAGRVLLQDVHPPAGGVAAPVGAAAAPHGGSRPGAARAGSGALRQDPCALRRARGGQRPGRAGGGAGGGTQRRAGDPGRDRWRAGRQSVAPARGDRARLACCRRGRAGGAPRNPRVGRHDRLWPLRRQLS